MKVAVCLSGQPRFLELCKDGIKSNLIDPNEADVFIHTWSYEKAPDEPYKFGGDGGWNKKRIDKNAHKNAIEIYKPVSYEVEEAFKINSPGKAYHHSFLNFRSGIPKEAEEAGMSLEQYASKIFNDAYCMWYGIMKCNMLANRHALVNGFEYDFVVRVRFDVDIQTKIELQHFDNRYLHYCDLGQPSGLVSDWLNFSSQRNMSVFSSACMNMQHADSFYLQHEISRKFQFCSELISAINLQRHEIPVSAFNANLSLPRF